MSFTVHSATASPIENDTVKCNCEEPLTEPHLFVHCSKIPAEDSITQEKAPELKKPEGDKKKKDKKEEKKVIEQAKVEIVEEDIQIEEAASAASAPIKQVMCSATFC